MAFDFKKEYKEYYMPKNIPQIIELPALNYIAVRGQGDPNYEGGEYKQALAVLYAVAYTLKMSYKTDHRIDGFFQYVVPPLEGFWWSGDGGAFDYADKSELRWISAIRLPGFISEKDVSWAVETASAKKKLDCSSAGFISEKDVSWAVETASAKKKLDCSSAGFITIKEGLCVQIMHHGAYDDEPATVALMDSFIAEQGYRNDMGGERLHHEIYLSDPRKSLPEKWKTVIRHPIVKI